MTDIIRNEVKNNAPHIEHKNVQQQLKKDVIPTSLEEIKRAKKARENAHTIGADIKREISMEIKNKLSESFEFIEESCGSGAPEFEFFDTPQSQTVHEGMEGCAVVANKYPIIGKASGVFAPIGVMSRNNRIYDEDHYDYLFTNQQLVDRIAHRGMLGTIGHHDKKVDDQDLAEGKVSHIVSDLHIQEEADGTRNLYGTLEILDTPAGHLLKTYYDSGIPLFVSSRGGGNLLPVPHESYKRVDKTKYFLETFDIVKNPGFLQAKPVYEKVSEGAEETQEVEPIKEEKEENVDKLDKLTEALTNFVNSITEAKKEDKAEDNETKEAKEKKEAKEATEAKEAKEAKIEEAEEDKEDIKVGKDEDKKDKEEKTPEDEKKEEAEDAIADTVSEDEKEDKAIEKGAMDIIDPHKGLNKKDIANGRVQLNLLDLAQAKQIHKDGLKNQKDLKDRAEEHAKAHPHQELPKKEEIAKQLRLALQNKVNEGAMGILEYTKEAAQRVIDRKTKQLVDSGKDMKNAEHEYKDKMSLDGHAINSKGMWTTRDTMYASSDHKDSIEKGARLNQGAMRIAKAGKRIGADTENLKYAGKGHAQEVNRQAQSHHDIKHMHEAQENSEYDKNMKIADDYDKLMMKQPAKSPDGSPNSVANYYQSKYQEYFDKAMQSRHAEQAKGKKENIKEEVEAQPVAPVQTGEIYKNAQDAENKPELPTTFDHQDLARALKANYKNTKEENK